MPDFRLTGEQELIYRAHRAVDVILERAYRAELDDSELIAVDDVPSVHSLILDLQIQNAEACAEALIDAGANPNEPENGLYNWVACAFAEHCDFALALEESVA